MTITGVKGIDVSRWNGAPDWRAAALSGLAFAGWRASSGLSGVDPEGPHDAQGIAANMLAGFAYHYAVGGDAGAQGSMFLGAIAAAYGPGVPLVLHLPVGTGMMLDAEDPSLSAGVLEALAAWLYFATRLWPSIYTSPSFATSALHNDPGLRRSPLWLADWTPPANVPAPWTRWWWWQTGTASVPGVRGAVDVDLFAGDTIDLQRFIRKPTVGINAHHPAVAYLQRTLKRSTALDVGPEDGWMGARTTAALVSFQRGVGITPDGVAGSVQTWPVVDFLAARDQG